MLVVPRDILPAMRYSAAAIGMALCLWGCGACTSTARLAQGMRAAGTAPSHWRQPRRWLGSVTAGGLFALGQRLEPTSPAKDRALHVASQLAGAATPHARVEPFEAQAASGAVAVDEPNRQRDRPANRPTKFVTTPAGAEGNESRAA